MIHKPNGSQNSSSVRKLTVEISGMTCEHCAIGIKNRIISLEGVLDQDVDYKNGLGYFKFDSEKVSKKQIMSIRLYTSTQIMCGLKG